MSLVPKTPLIRKHRCHYVQFAHILEYRSFCNFCFARNDIPRKPTCLFRILQPLHVKCGHQDSSAAAKTSSFIFKRFTTNEVIIEYDCSKYHQYLP